MSTTQFPTPVWLQVFTKDDGYLTKKVSRVDGQLVKDAKQCRLNTGTVITEEVTSMKGLADLLGGLQINQAIALSNSDYRDIVGYPQQVVSKALADQYPDAVTRSAEHFKFEAAAALVMFDRDSSDGELMSVARAMGILGEVVCVTAISNNANGEASRTRAKQCAWTGPHRWCPTKRRRPFPSQAVDWRTQTQTEFCALAV